VERGGRGLGDLVDQYGQGFGVTPPASARLTTYYWRRVQDLCNACVMFLSP